MISDCFSLSEKLWPPAKAFLLTYILVGMEPTHIVRRRFVGPIDLHLLVQVVSQHQAVYDREPVGLHGMSRSVMEVPHVRIVEVRHLFCRHCLLVQAVLKQKYQC